MCHKTTNIMRVAGCLVAISVLFSALLGFRVFAADNGTCGVDLKWSFSAGTLTISGSGDMQNYNELDCAPWKQFSNEINVVILPKDLTSIGSFAFYDCSSLKAISIPDTVKTIYEKAFYNCTSIRFVDLSDTLSHIGKSAFYNCEKLESISLPDSIETISDKAFYLCRSISNVMIPQNVKQLGKQAFAYCESLLRVEITANITSVPEWCFYGCEKLAQITLPGTVTEIGSYAFKRCDELYTVSHPGNKDTANSIRNQIAKDVPTFQNSGFVSYGNLENSTQTSDVKTDKNGNAISQTNTTVQVDEHVTLVSIVERTYQDGNYTVHITMTVNGDAGWEEAIVALRSALSNINDRYSLDGKSERITVTLYLKNTSSVSQHFLKELAGRSVTVEVVDSNGSVWTIDCSALEFNNVQQDVGVSYVVGEAPPKTSEKLGVDTCYEVKFDETSKINTGVVITLPDSAANATAFLYEKDFFGRLKRLQATVVDGNANARFYVSSVNKNTTYIIAINVPNENIDDIIIPDEAGDPFGAIARLEKIEYVSTGPRTLLGFTIGQILLFVLGFLLIVSLVIGIIMYLKNKQNISFAKVFKANKK